jgi:hypothetical protein
MNRVPAQPRNVGGSYEGPDESTVLSSTGPGALTGIELRRR